jgi:DHA2 family methylenomycin A resistance protein-like MFS transporter
LIGGALVQLTGWQSIFWINIPLGLFAVWLVLRTTPESSAEEAGGSLDIPGAVTLVGGIALISFALVSTDTASAGELGALVGGAVLLFALFVLVEKRSKDPLLPLSVFGRPLFMGSVIANLLANVSFAAVVFLMSLFLQDVMGYGALKAGALLLPATATVLVVNVLGQRLTQNKIYRLPIALGMAFLAAGCIDLTFLDRGTYMSLLPGFILVGIGVGLQITPATELAIDSAGVGEGVASGAFKATSMIGGSLGVAAATAVFQSVSSSDLSSKVKQGLGGGFDKTHLLDIMTGSYEHLSRVPLEVIAMTHSAFDDAAGLAMWVAAGAAIIGIVTSVILLKGSKGFQGPGHGGH